MSAHCSFEISAHELVWLELRAAYRSINSAGRSERTLSPRSWALVVVDSIATWCIDEVIFVS